jgi:hypothetical protein
MKPLNKKQLKEIGGLVTTHGTFGGSPGGVPTKPNNPSTSGGAGGMIIPGTDDGLEFQMWLNDLPLTDNPNPRGGKTSAPMLPMPSDLGGGGTPGGGIGDTGSTRHGPNERLQQLAGIKPIHEQEAETSKVDKVSKDAEKIVDHPLLDRINTRLEWQDLMTAIFNKSNDIQQVNDSVKRTWLQKTLRTIGKEL